METPLFEIDGLQPHIALNFLRLARTIENKTRWAALNLIFSSLGLLPLFLSGNPIGIFFFIVFNLPSIAFAIDYLYQLYALAEISSNFSLLKVFFLELIAMIAKIIGSMSFLIVIDRFFHLRLISISTLGVLLLMLVVLGIGLYFDKSAAGHFMNFISQDFTLEIDRRFQKINQNIIQGLKQYQEGKGLMFFPLFAMIGIYLSLGGLADIGHSLIQYAHVWNHFENQYPNNRVDRTQEESGDPSFTQIHNLKVCPICTSDSNPMNSRYCGDCGHRL